MHRTQFDEQLIDAMPAFESSDAALDVRGGNLYLARGGRDVKVEPDCDDGALDVDADGRIHVAFTRRRGIIYHLYDGDTLERLAVRTAALPFGRQPSILAGGERVIIAYLAEHVPVDPQDDVNWQDKPWQRRIGLGGRIAAVVFQPDGKLTRHTLAASKQIVKPVWPKHDTFQYDYPNVDARVRLEQFGPPVLSRGGDGVVTALWVNLTRRWVYASRYLEDHFTPPAEARGPLEGITARITAPRRSGGDIPFVTQAPDRTFLHSLASPPREVDNVLRIDFLQYDNLAVCSNLEQHVIPMRRSEHNPVIAVREGEIGLAGGVTRRDDGVFIADLIYKEHGRRWRHEYPVESADGITFTRGGIIPVDETITVDGKERPKQLSRLFSFDDGDRAPRFKGLFQDDADGTWGTLVPAYSDDGDNWTTLRDPQHFPVCDGITFWRDEADIPARRYKASGNARSWCGRVCAQFVSDDGLHWRDLRDTLDFDDPFGPEPYWQQSYGDGRGVGRIIVDPWAGPDDEDEIHGGVVFRDGERWLCHYMKWTCDGHIIPALASSNDGINFTRVSGGAPTLPLAEPGEWDSGRLALHDPPCRVGDVWRQYYTGCGWKHGMEGTGKKPHQTSGNVGPFSPMQIGFAEIGVGRWCGLRLTRDADEGQLVTVPLQLRGPARFEHDIVNADMIECAWMKSDGSATPLRVGDTIDSAEPIRLAVRVRGRRAMVYSLTLT